MKPGDMVRLKLMYHVPSLDRDVLLIVIRIEKNHETRPDLGGRIKVLDPSDGSQRYYYEHYLELISEAR